MKKQSNLSQLLEYCEEQETTAEGNTDFNEQAALAAGGVVGFTAPLDGKKRQDLKKEHNSVASFMGFTDVSDFHDVVDTIDINTEHDTEQSRSPQRNKAKRKKLNHNQQMMWSHDQPLPITIPVKYSLLETCKTKSVAKVICDKQIKSDSVAVISDFIKFCNRFLHIQDFPVIHLYATKKPNMTTGAYDLSNNTISCLVGKRLVVDVLRTIAHELTHRKQHERGDLDIQLAEIDPMDEMGDIDTPFENEAYTLAGNLVKIYCRKQKMLPKDELYALNESRNYHMSTTPVANIIDVPIENQSIGRKPKGFWYACGTGWIRWVRGNMPEWLGKHHYELSLDYSNILKLSGYDDIKNFTEEFGAHPDSGMSLESDIDWPKVASVYSGIEICPHNKKAKYDFMWYYTWDVASGCVWNSDAIILKKKLERSPIDLVERSKKFSKPIEVYHGTTDKFLNSILSQGLIPAPKEGSWRGKYDDGTESNPSLASLEGTYLTKRIPTAMSYAYDANRKAAKGFGVPIVIQAEIVPQNTYADEDNIDIEAVASKVIMSYTGRPWNPWYVRGLKDGAPEIYREMQDDFAKAFHERYSPGPLQKLNKELLHWAFDVAVERRLPYAADANSSWNATSSYWMAVERFAGADKVSALKDAQGHTKHPDNFLSPVEAEKQNKAMQERITRTYRQYGASIGNEWASMRTVNPIKFTGRNKITAIVSLPTNDDNRVIRILYGKPSQALIDGIRTFNGVNYQVVKGYDNNEQSPDIKDTVAKHITDQQPSADLLTLEKNVLDKMGNKVAVKNVRRGSVAGPVYMDKHDSNQKSTKAVMKKVAKNLNRKAYSKKPPMMGIS
jgi:hypothetical protein